MKKLVNIIKKSKLIKMNGSSLKGVKIISIMPVSVWLLLFLALPLVWVIMVSFLQRGTYGQLVYSFTIHNYVKIVNAIYLKVFIDSVKIAFLTSLFSLMIGYPFAYLLCGFSKKIRSILLIMVVIPFWTNSLVRTYAWVLLLRTEGIINSYLLQFGVIAEPLKMIYTEGAVILGMVYTLFPFMVLPIYISIEKLDKSLLEASSDLGASSIRRFITVTLPLTASGIFAGVILVFIPSLGYFFIPDLMGGGKNIIIGNLIKNQFLSARDWPFGASASVVLVMITLICTGIYIKIFGKKGGLKSF